MKKIYALLLLIFACGFSAVAEEYVSVKASGVALTADGTVWTTSIARREDGKGSVLLSRSDDLKVWKRDTLQLDDCIEAVLWAEPSGKMMMFCSTTDGNIRTKICQDPQAEQPAWTDGADVGRGPWKCTAPPVASQGSWILPVAFQKGVFTLVSSDNGHSWTRSKTFLRVPDKVSGDNNPVLTADGKVLSIYMRTTGTTHCYRA